MTTDREFVKAAGEFVRVAVNLKEAPPDLVRRLRGQGGTAQLLVRDGDEREFARITLARSSADKPDPVPIAANLREAARTAVEGQTEALIHLLGPAL